MPTKTTPRTAPADAQVARLEDPVTRRRFEDSLRRWQEKGKSVADAVRISERLSQGDLAIRINTRG